MITRKHLRLRTILPAGILAVFVPLTSVFPAFWRVCFCMPAACLSAAFMGVPCVPAPDGYVLVHDVLPVYVTLSCSAATFFILVVALVLGLIYTSTHRLRHGLRCLLWVLPVCYGVTIVANTGRITLGWLAGRWSRLFLAENFWGGIHTGVGVLVFLTFLVGTYGLMTWRLSDDGNR